MEENDIRYTCLRVWYGETFEDAVKRRYPDTDQKTLTDWKNRYEAEQQLTIGMCNLIEKAHKQFTDKDKKRTFPIFTAMRRPASETERDYLQTSLEQELLYLRETNTKTNIDLENRQCI